MATSSTAFPKINLPQSNLIGFSLDFWIRVDRSLLARETESLLPSGDVGVAITRYSRSKTPHVLLQTVSPHNEDRDRFLVSVEYQTSSETRLGAPEGIEIPSEMPNQLLQECAEIEQSSADIIIGFPQDSNRGARLRAAFPMFENASTMFPLEASHPPIDTVWSVQGIKTTDDDDFDYYLRIRRGDERLEVHLGFFVPAEQRAADVLDYSMNRADRIMKSIGLSTHFQAGG